VSTLTSWTTDFPLMRAPLAPPHEQILSSTAHLLLEDQDVDTLCQRVFDHLRVPLRLDVYFHYLVSADGTHLELASSGGNDVVRAALGTTLKFGEAVCGTVAQSCMGMHVTGVQRRMDEMTSLIRSFGIRCYTCNPLLVHGQLVGTFSFGSSQRDAFSTDELELIRLVVQQVTAATGRRLQNGRMQQLERLAAAGRMSAALAHEINNPLETLSQSLYLLRDEASGEQRHELLRIAEDQVKRLVETSRRTLEMFRGRQLAPQPVDVSKLASELTGEIRLPHHARLHIEIEPELQVNAISGELRQVLYNLLLNAAQFSPVGKEVALIVRRSDDHVEVRVRDEGKGISADTRKHLFEPFFTTRGGDGTGVGLWLSREMVERIGGTLTFESEPAVRPGTEFIVRLPLLP